MNAGRADRKAFERGVRLAWEIARGCELSSPAIVEMTGVDRSVAKRDMQDLERLLPVKVQQWSRTGRKTMRLGQGYVSEPGSHGTSMSQEAA